MTKITKYGLIYTPIVEETAYLFGAITGVSKAIVREDANWRPNRPTPESQAYVYFDDWGCVLHSDLICLASIFDRQIELGMISTTNITWLTNNGYFDIFGKINFNDRFAIYNGGVKCTIGTYVSIAADSIRNTGLTPQSKWNYTNSEFTSCPDFIQKPPQFMYDLGIEFKKRFKLNYEYVDANNREAKNEVKKYSPLQILVVAWHKNAQGLYYNPDNNFNHAVVDPIKIEVGANNIIWDSYSDYDNTPFEKELVPEYRFGNQAMAWFVNQIIIKEEYNMITYKQIKKSAVYFAVGKKLIPFMTEWEDYLAEFSDAVLIELSDAEFANFTVVTTLGVKTV